jgi:hypothetical protein
MNVDEFLAWAEGREGRWELIDGRPIGLDTSDVPALAERDGVDAVWCVGDAAGASRVEAASAGNATQVKNIWTPYGE